VNVKIVMLEMNAAKSMSIFLGVTQHGNRSKKEQVPHSRKL